MARGKGSGGYRENAPAKVAANAVAGGSASPPVMEFTGGPWGSQGEQIATQQANNAAVDAMPRPAPPRRTMSLDAPTTRPDEPVTAGLPIGPGAAPPPDLGLAKLAKYLPALEIIASRSDSSEDTRNFVRLVRSGSVAL